MTPYARLCLRWLLLAAFLVTGCDPNLRVISPGLPQIEESDSMTGESVHNGDQESSPPTVRVVNVQPIDRDSQEGDEDISAEIHDDVSTGDLGSPDIPDSALLEPEEEGDTVADSEQDEGQDAAPAEEEDPDVSEEFDAFVPDSAANDATDTLREEGDLPDPEAEADGKQGTTRRDG